MIIFRANKLPDTRRSADDDNAASPVRSAERSEEKKNNNSLPKFNLHLRDDESIGLVGFGLGFFAPPPKTPYHNLTANSGVDHFRINNRYKVLQSSVDKA